MSPDEIATMLDALAERDHGARCQGRPTTSVALTGDQALTGRRHGPLRPKWPSGYRSNDPLPTHSAPPPPALRLVTTDGEQVAYAHAAPRYARLRHGKWWTTRAPTAR